MLRFADVTIIEKALGHRVPCNDLSGNGGFSLRLGKLEVSGGVTQLSMSLCDVVGGLPNNRTASFVGREDVEFFILIERLPFPPDASRQVGTATVVVDNFCGRIDQFNPVRVRVLNERTGGSPIALEEARNMAGVDLFFFSEVDFVPEDSEVHEAAKASKSSSKFFFVYFGYR